MIKHQNVWLPDGETHLTEWMSRAGEVVDGTGTYQINKLRKALEYCSNFRRAVDVGAHVGLWSIQLAKQFKWVDAFEPVQQHMDCLIRNLLNLKNTSVCQVALGEKDQRIGIHTAPTSSGDSWVNGAGNIRMMTLDAFKFQDVDFLKIDTEGYETFVLRGAEETLKRCRPCVIVEQKRDMSEKFGLPQKSAVVYLKSLGATLRAEMSGDYIFSFT